MPDAQVSPPPPHRYRNIENHLTRTDKPIVLSCAMAGRVALCARVCFQQRGPINDKSSAKSIASTGEQSFYACRSRFGNLDGLETSGNQFRRFRCAGGPVCSQAAGDPGKFHAR